MYDTYIVISLRVAVHIIQCVYPNMVMLLPNTVWLGHVNTQEKLVYVVYSYEHVRAQK